MSDSEVMAILFHNSRHRDLKSFYLGYVCHHMRKKFPCCLSYNRLGIMNLCNMSAFVNEYRHYWHKQTYCIEE